MYLRERLCCEVGLDKFVMDETYLVYLRDFVVKLECEQFVMD